MDLIFAQTASADPAAIGDWLITTGTVLGFAIGLLSIATLLKSLLSKPAPQPLIVELSKEFTPIERTEKLEARIKEVDDERRESVGRCYQAMRESTDKLRSEMRVEMSESRREGREDTKGIHSRIDEVLKAVSRLEGKP